MTRAQYTRRIQELEEERRKNLRQASRARKRSRAALRRRDWKGYRSARAVARNNNQDAQENLRRIRILRDNRQEASRAARLLKHRRYAGLSEDGYRLYWFDGKKVKKEAYDRLVWARKNGWRGVLTSGHREPSYSRSLCYAMCGAPSCSGRCAGVNSNHVRNAVDVTDYYTFGRLMKRYPGQKWFNALGWRDPVHFSPNGR